MQDKKVDIRSTWKLDVEFIGVICKGHVNNLAATVKYVCKEGDVTTDMKNLFQGRLLTKNELVRKIADKEGVEVALRYYGESYPKMAMLIKIVLVIFFTKKWKHNGRGELTKCREVSEA